MKHTLRLVLLHCQFFLLVPQTECKLTFDTYFCDKVFHALSHGSLHFVLHGSLINRLSQRVLLAFEENQPINPKWLFKLPWRAKQRLPCVRA